MVEEQKPADIETLKNELAEIKRDMMRKELEDIKREKMRQELEEMKAEQATKETPQYYVRHTPKLSILTAIMAVLALLVAGYMLGTVYGFNMAAEVDKYLISYNLPISGSLVVAIVAVVLAFIGLGLVTVAKK
jgi:predicted unusual protein kinase regulating ubiquinone biosynthesis (AarF/ABC1/UbiB family)